MSSFHIDDSIKFVPSRGTPDRRRVLAANRTHKDFSKVYSNEERQGDESFKDLSKIAKEERKTSEIRKDFTTEEMGEEKKSPAMVFDLHKSQKGEKDEKKAIASFKEYSPALRDESLSALNKYVSSKENLESLLSKSGKENAFMYQGKAESAQFALEQPDLSYINPLSAAEQSISYTLTDSVNKSQMRSSVHEIVDQLVEKISTLQQTGRTDTTLTLKHPPLFEGVKITISEFDTAKGEFNIKFENLTQTAKQVIDMQANQDALKLGLEQKGLTLHIITATTYDEVKTMPAGESAKGEREHREKGSDERERQEQQEQG